MTRGLPALLSRGAVIGPAALSALGAAVCAAVLVAHGARAVDDAAAKARAGGGVLAVAAGDVAARDVPKALDFMQGRAFGDPHYAGEVAWYPFMTPLLAAATMSITGRTVHGAYLLTGVLLAALWLLAVVAALCVYGGLPGVAIFPLVLLLGIVAPDTGPYPFETARFPLTLFLALAGAVLAGGGLLARSRRASAALGALNGCLGLWHGASFLVATLTSGSILAHAALRCRGRPEARRELAIRTLAFLGPFLLLFSWLVVPQLVRYGTLRESDAARLWLEDYFHLGNDPSGLFTLRLFPGGIGLAWLAAFALGLKLLPGERAKALPLLGGFLLAKGLAQAGFVLHSADHPALARLASAVLVVPPHTLNDLGDYLFALMKLWLLAVAALGGSRLLSSEGVRGWIGRRAPFLLLPAARWSLPAAASLALFSALLSRPADLALRSQTVDAVWAHFAEQAARIAGQDSIFGGEYLLRFAHARPLWFPSPPHSNPYVDGERRAAEEALVRLARAGERRGAGEILRRYSVRYALGDNPVSSLCGESVALQGPDVSLVKLRPDCSP